MSANFKAEAVICRVKTIYDLCGVIVTPAVLLKTYVGVRVHDGRSPKYFGYSLGDVPQHRDEEKLQFFPPASLRPGSSLDVLAQDKGDIGRYRRYRVVEIGTPNEHLMLTGGGCFAPATLIAIEERVVRTEACPGT